MTLIIFNNSCDAQQNQFQKKFAYRNFFTVLKMHFLSHTKKQKTFKQEAGKHGTNHVQRDTSK